jgi:hypothetical protein
MDGQPWFAVMDHVDDFRIAQVGAISLNVSPSTTASPPLTATGWR